MFVRPALSVEEVVTKTNIASSVARLEEIPITPRASAESQKLFVALSPSFRSLQPLNGSRGGRRALRQVRDAAALGESDGFVSTYIACAAADSVKACPQ